MILPRSCQRAATMPDDGKALVPRAGSVRVSQLSGEPCVTSLPNDEPL